ncbi:MAG TPA: hypothetical protein VIK18_13690, partial [Pirellulales bacterium]
PFFTGVPVLAGQQRDTVMLRRLPVAADDDRPGRVSLDGFQVASNSTGMVHSEQMLPLPGGIRLVRLSGDRCRVENHTPWNLEHAALMDQHSAIPIGTLHSGEQREVSLAELSWFDLAVVNSGTLEAYGQALAKASKSQGQVLRSAVIDGLDLRDLVSIAASNINANELCLVGLVAGPIPGLKIEPATVPAHIANLVIAHLDYGPLPEPERDAGRRPPSNPIEQPE